MQIEYLDIKRIIPYKNNPRHNEQSVDKVASSIEAFGFRVPILIDEKNEIIAGHTRLKAAQKLGLKSVPVIRVDDLSPEQVKAFRIADNSVGEDSTWDWEKLEIELEGISFDMSDFGIELSLDAPNLEDETEWTNQRERTFNKYNLDLIDYSNMTNDFWQMPIIHNDGTIPTDLIGFKYAKSSKKKDVGIHFYIDDYQFERVWDRPEEYVEVLKEYECILSPDFSLYMDMPMPMKIWNIYRSRQIGAYYQSRGIKVIPTLSWAEPETFEFCFLGIPRGSIVSVSTIGVKRDEEAVAIWKAGMQRALEVIEPSAVLVWGGELEFDFGEPKVIYYDNKIFEPYKKEEEVLKNAEN